jgi:uncharacterized membrane protein YcjF (UPF0283 family)
MNNDDNEDDDDDDDELYSTGSSGLAPEETERDEVKEVQKMSQKDTSRVHMWRFVVTCVLALTAVAVTLTTYRVLTDEQQRSFDTAVSAVRVAYSLLASSKQ